MTSCIASVEGESTQVMGLLLRRSQNPFVASESWTLFQILSGLLSSLLQLVASNLRISTSERGECSRSGVIEWCASVLSMLAIPKEVLSLATILSSPTPSSQQRYRFSKSWTFEVYPRCQEVAISRALARLRAHKANRLQNRNRLACAHHRQQSIRVSA